MGNLNGFVKLHRKMIEWGWYSDCVVKDVFIHILMVATFKPTKYLGYDLKPGQAVIGRKKLADELGFTEQQVRTALKKLESTGEISLFSTNKFTIATVENWEFYQSGDDDDNQQITNNQPTNNQQITNNQPHLKNVKNVKKDIYISPRNIIPPTLEMVSRYCTERNNGVDPQKFIDWYEARGWLVGRVKMKDWQAAVRTWEKNNKPKKGTGNPYLDMLGDEQ